MTTAICLNCGKEFERKAANQKFCSPECRGKYRNCTGIKKKAVHALVCKQCGKEFMAANKNTRYCSDRCRYGAWQKRKQLTAIPKICPVCGKEFLAKSQGEKYCSRRCAKEVERLAQRERSKYQTDQGRPITPTSKMLIGWYWKEDKWTVEQISKEINRPIEVIQQVLDECGLDESNWGCEYRQRKV